MQVLQTHVVVGAFPAGALTDGQTLMTLANVTLTIGISTSGVTVSSSDSSMASVTTPDASVDLCGGSVIHLIDAVLLPPVRSL